MMQLVWKKQVWNVRVCTTFLSQLRGWMLRTLPHHDGLLFILPRTQTMDIHTWFCLRSLNIAFLDEHQRVVQLYRNVRPFTFFLRGVPARYILEVKDAHALRAGARIKFIRTDTEKTCEKR